MELIPFNNEPDLRWSIWSRISTSKP